MSLGGTDLPSNKIIIRYLVSSHLLSFQWCISLLLILLLQLGPSCTWAPQSCQYKHSIPTASQYALLNCHIFRNFYGTCRLLVAMVSVGCGCFLGQRDLHWAFGQRWFPNLPWLEVVETVKSRFKRTFLRRAGGRSMECYRFSPLWQSPRSMWSWGVK